MLALIARLLGGPIVNGLLTAYRAKLDAAQSSERISADLAAKEIEADIAARADAKAIILAEQGAWYTACIRPLFALPFVIYNGKLVIWDKVLGWGSTDPLSSELFQIEMIVIGAYFLGRSAEKVARTIRGA